MDLQTAQLRRSNVPGPGRLLENGYGFLGRKAETSLSNIAMKFGFGPSPTAMTIWRTLHGYNTPDSTNKKQLGKAGKQLLKYISGESFIYQLGFMY